MFTIQNIKLTDLKGVGPKKEQLLNKLEIYSIGDLIKHFPRYYEDFTKISQLGKEHISGHKNLFKVRVSSIPLTRRTRSNLQLMTFVVEDDSGECEVVFFNQSFLAKTLYPGKEIYLYGSIERKYNKLQITSPIILKKSLVGGFNPIYSLTKGLTNVEVRNFINQALEKHLENVRDIVPKSINSRYNLPDLKAAIKFLHFPKSKRDIIISKKKLAFNELLLLQMILDNTSPKKHNLKTPQMMLGHEPEVNSFINKLPFKLTGAQTKVYREILEDMSSQKSMHRLLQGDVGAGKTVIAAIAMLYAFLNKYQSALMAPTEILAKQHFSSLSDLFSDYDIKIGLLTGDMKKNQKDEVYCKTENGDLDMLIGTHALIQEDLKFKNLGLSIIDEQHRFGVQQRKDLALKGDNPHNLVMTATPIPRTLALVLYGDMDVSVLDELPPNRKAINTFVINDSYLNRLDNFILEQINNGKQVFVVAPLIEEGEIEARSLEEIYEYYKRDIFKNIKIALVHGRMNQSEKDQIMDDFSKNKIDLLISTTVIEVGINIPNANLMIIYDSDRFGLSQLHQLRGRVGRGSDEAYCVLINNNTSENSYERMKVMQQSNDGFFIAEKDLELRGQGDIVGYRQHGLPNLLIADLFEDYKIIETIKKDYDLIIEEINKDKSLKAEIKDLIEFIRITSDII